MDKEFPRLKLDKNIIESTNAMDIIADVFVTIIKTDFLDKEVKGYLKTPSGWATLVGSLIPSTKTIISSKALLLQRWMNNKDLDVILNQGIVKLLFNLD